MAPSLLLALSLAATLMLMLMPLETECRGLPYPMHRHGPGGGGAGVPKPYGPPARGPAGPYGGGLHMHGGPPGRRGPPPPPPPIPPPRPRGYPDGPRRRRRGRGRRPGRRPPPERSDDPRCECKCPQTAAKNDDDDGGYIKEDEEPHYPQPDPHPHQPPPPYKELPPPGSYDSSVVIRPIETVPTVFEKSLHPPGPTGPDVAPPKPSGEHSHDHDHHDHSHDGDGDYDHSFWSHGHKLRSENPCDGVANAEIKLSTGTKKFIFTSKNAHCDKMTWGRALDFCNWAGMQAVSMWSGRPEEDVKAVLDKIKDPEFFLDSFWTSGYVTHSKDKSNPIVMWTSASLPRTEEVVPGSGFFAKHGLDGLSQPDNHQGRKGDPRRDEECVVAALSLKGAQGEKEDDRENGSPGLYDISCKQKRYVVCEEKKALDKKEEELSLYFERRK